MLCARLVMAIAIMAVKAHVAARTGLYRLCLSSVRHDQGGNRGSTMQTAELLDTGEQ